jgi:catechol 2,3-dioxygenase-like lactoylglutathione lyase family enzyme
VHAHERPTAALGDGRDDRDPHEDPQARPAGRHAGLYHYALLYPSREELARAAVRLAATRTPIEGASDHRTHEAIYLPDADGNGIELAADRPREEWPRDLGYAAAPRRSTSTRCWPRSPARSRRARRSRACAWATCTCTSATSTQGLRFYRDVLGFEVQANLGSPPSCPPAATTTTSASTSGAAAASARRPSTPSACASRDRAAHRRLDDEVRRGAAAFDARKAARRPYNDCRADAALSSCRGSLAHNRLSAIIRLHWKGHGVALAGGVRRYPEKPTSRT